MEKYLYISLNEKNENEKNENEIDNLIKKVKELIDEYKYLIDCIEYHQYDDGDERNYIDYPNDREI